MHILVTTIMPNRTIAPMNNPVAVVQNLLVSIAYSEVKDTLASEF